MTLHSSKNGEQCLTSFNISSNGDQSVTLYSSISRAVRDSVFQYRNEDQYVIVKVVAAITLHISIGMGTSKRHCTLAEAPGTSMFLCLQIWE